MSQIEDYFGISERSRKRGASSADTQRIVQLIARRFRTFGGGQAPSDFNPLTHWLKDAPLQFAAGVDVADVVTFVLREAGRR